MIQVWNSDCGARIVQLLLGGVEVVVYVRGAVFCNNVTSGGAG